MNGGRVVRSALLLIGCACGSAAAAQSDTALRSTGVQRLAGERMLANSLLHPQLPSVYDYRRLGLFCKLDVQLEERLRLPLRFRLGDPLQVDALEGKGPLWRHAVEP